MPTAKSLATFAAAALAMAVSSQSASAATAHNSQAGSWGPVKNNCAATPYFPADSGCLGSYIQRYQEDGDLTLPSDVRARYRPRGPLQ